MLCAISSPMWLWWEWLFFLYLKLNNNLFSSMQWKRSMSHIRLRLIIADLSLVWRRRQHRISHFRSINLACRLLEIPSNILYYHLPTLFAMFRQSILNMFEQYMSMSTSHILEWKSMWKSTIWKCILFKWWLVSQRSFWTYLFYLKYLHK